MSIGMGKSVMLNKASLNAPKQATTLEFTEMLIVASTKLDCALTLLDRKLQGSEQLKAVCESEAPLDLNSRLRLALETIEVCHKKVEALTEYISGQE